MENEKINKMNMLKKIISILLKIIYNIFIILCCILLVIVVLQRISDSRNSLYGYRIFRVASGSMVPKFNVDEVVVCKEINALDLNIGDIVVYRGTSGDFANKLIMHEIIKINKNENNELTFYVKGIQNPEGDPNVTSSQILGKVVLKSDILTLLYSLAISPNISFFIIIILVINVFISFRPTKKEIIKLNEHNEDGKLEKENVVEKKKVRYKLKDYKKYIKIIRKNKDAKEK